MTTETKYICESCGAVFENEEDCLQHEKLHSICVCQSGIAPIKHKFKWYDNYHSKVSDDPCYVEVYVDFERKALVQELAGYDNGRYIRHNQHEEIPIRFCPFCGRCLDG